MDIQAIQQGLATAASNINGLRGFASLPGSLVPPVFAPIDVEADYNQTFSNSMTLVQFTCAVYVSNGYTAVGAAALVGYIAPSGSSSIKAALESDRTLGGVAKTLNVDRVRGAYRIYTVGNADYLGALFEVRVWG